MSVMASGLTAADPLVSIREVAPGKYDAWLERDLVGSAVGRLLIRRGDTRQVLGEVHLPGSVPGILEVRLVGLSPHSGGEMYGDPVLIVGALATQIETRQQG